MSSRRQARELALKVLYSLEIHPSDPDARIQDILALETLADPLADTRVFFRNLVWGVLDTRTDTDALINHHTRRWKVSRMAVVDRNILRMAAHELLRMPEVPAVVTINEAVDIAKKYGTRDSGAFINGILDSIRLSLGGKI